MDDERRTEDELLAALDGSDLEVETDDDDDWDDGEDDWEG